MGNWDKTQDGFKGKVIVLIVLLVLYIGITIYYVVLDTKRQEINRVYDRLNEGYKETLVGLSGLFGSSANALQEMVIKRKATKIMDFYIWNLKKTSDWVCKQVYNVLVKLTHGDEHIKVNYVHLIEYKHKTVVRTLAFANQGDRAPKIYLKDRNLQGSKYYDSKVIKEGKSDIIIFDNPNDIYDKFYYSGSNRASYKGRYEQYIGIPVVDNKNKVIGVFQVLSEEGHKIARHKEELREIAVNHILPFAYILLMTCIVEDGLSLDAQMIIPNGSNLDFNNEMGGEQSAI